MNQTPSNLPRPNWLRWLCYVFLAVGFGLTFFHDQVAVSIGLATDILQFVAIVTLLIGIGLFLVVREPSSINRVDSYRSVFGPSEPPPSNQPTSPDEPAHNNDKESL